MLAPGALLDAFEREQAARAPNYQQNLRIFEALYEEARTLGIMPLEDPLEGIEVDLRLAQVINVRTPSGTDRAGA